MLSRCFYLYKSIICMNVMKNLYLLYYIRKFICCLLFHKSLSLFLYSFFSMVLCICYVIVNIYVIYLINILLSSF